MVKRTAFLSSCLSNGNDFAPAEMKKLHVEKVFRVANRSSILDTLGWRFFLDINGDLTRQLGIKAWSLEFRSLAGGANLQAIDTCLALKAMMRRVHQGSRCKQKREKN